MENGNASSLIRSMQEAIDFLDGEKLKGRRSHIDFKKTSVFKATDVKLLRAKLGLSQLSFSHLLGVSKRTVEEWEAGKNIPNGPSSRLLELLSDDESAMNMMEKYMVRK